MIAILARALLISVPAVCPDTVPAGRFIEPGSPVLRVVHIETRHGLIDFMPSDWIGGVPMVAVAPDSFAVPGLDRFAMKVVRDGRGCVSALRTYGFGFERALQPAAGPALPIEEVLDGDVRRGTLELLPALDGAIAARLGQVLLRSPGRSERAVAFLADAARAFPETAELHATLGDAYVAAGAMREAAASYRAALRIDPSVAWPASALRMLRSESRLPGTPARPTLLDSLFEPPSAAEIARVRAEWRARDLEPADVAVVREYPQTIGGIDYTARVIRHRVHGDTHYGLVLVPAGARNAPLVVEAKGVSPSFFPLRPGGLTVPEVLGPDAARAILVAPAYRGESLIVDADTFTSAGDRSDVWDGATDDLLAFLVVAKRTTPEADTTRVCVFGRSRGGTVALLASIREPSIDCAVAWAAPTDWFELMGQQGWTVRQAAEEALYSSSELHEIGGQFLNTFLRRVAAGEEPMERARRRMLASSPLWFAADIGCVQAHWGVDDVIVPVRNGRAFGEQAASSRCYEPVIHERAGHDQDRIVAPILSARYLASHLFAE